MFIGYGQNMWRLNTVAWCKYYWSFLHIIIYMNISYLWLKYKCDFEDHCFKNEGILIYTSCILFFSLAVVIRENFFNSVDTDEFNKYVIIFHAMDIPYSTFALISILFILRFFLTFFFSFVVHLYLSACSICFSKSYL